MSRNNDYDDQEGRKEDGEQSSDNDNDDDFKEDMEALRRACMITGMNFDCHNDAAEEGHFNSAGAGSGDEGCGVGDGMAWESDGEDDIKLFRSIRERFSMSEDVCEPLSVKPLSIFPALPSGDGDEEDFEMLRSIQRRFSAYDGSDTAKHSTEDLLQKPEQVHASGIASENGTSNDMFMNRTNTCEGFPDNEQACDYIRDSVATANIILDSKEACEPVHLGEDTAQTFAVADWQQSDACKSSELPRSHSSFPESVQVFIDAIRRNRAYQRFLRSKLIHIETRIEENKKLKERFKILRDFQVSCKRITGKALSQKKDPRVQLISAQRSRSSDDSEVNDKKVSVMNSGPAENSHVANYRMALTKFPLSFPCKKWSNEEKNNLAKGIRQQFQEMLLNVSMDRFSGVGGSSGDSNNLDNILTSIKDLDITPEMIRRFLPKVKWDNLASIYVTGRSGSECEARWLNWEDPLINRNPWSAEEDTNLLCIIQHKGITDWFDIAISLGTSRTPFQCLARYQRSLNACILKREWTEDEDDQLRMAVEKFGEHNWQSVASLLKGRTGTQCSNRWKKSLHPTRLSVGQWDQNEDKHLKVAVVLFGPKNWNKIAQFVPGRTQVQCRERWVNALDPSLNRGKWTEEEDLRLTAAVTAHGHCWSKVAAHLPSRTDNQCWRRWKLLNPDEVPLVQEARRMRRTAFICNFVDRESERPKLDPKDFLALPVTDTLYEAGNIMPSRENRRNIMSSNKDKRKLREKAGSKNKKDAATCKSPQKIQSRRKRKRKRSESQQVAGITGGQDDETLGGNRAIERKKTKRSCLKGGKSSEAVGDHSSSCQRNSVIQRKKTRKSCQRKNKSSEAVEDHSSSDQVSTLLTSNNATSQKKFVLNHSREGKHTVPDTNSQALVSLFSESVQSGIYGMEASGENNPSSRREKMTPRRRSKCRCAEMGEEVRKGSNISDSDCDDDITLAHFINNNRLKKRINGSSNPPKTISNKADDNAQLVVDSAGESVSMNRERAHQAGNPSTVNITAQDKELYREYQGEDGIIAPREAVNTNPETDTEADNITLTPFNHERNRQGTIVSNDRPTVLPDDDAGGWEEMTTESVGIHLESTHVHESGDVSSPCIRSSDKEPGKIFTAEGGSVHTSEAVQDNLEDNSMDDDFKLVDLVHKRLKRRKKNVLQDNLENNSVDEDFKLADLARKRLKRRKKDVLQDNLEDNSLDEDFKLADLVQQRLKSRKKNVLLHSG